MALKKCRMSFPRKRESRKIIVILNLFQDLLKMLKQVQHDKEKPRFPPLARMTPRAFLTIHATKPA
ncbi:MULTISPECIES: hypothetical protein [unclassified Rickettsia]|uniref:hypothetical protein n=1 Tax=unclassified Rickettsia TaxID=114295 RepID=UPI003132E42A